jgi:hypothetical protein
LAWPGVSGYSGRDDEAAEQVLPHIDRATLTKEDVLMRRVCVLVLVALPGMTLLAAEADQPAGLAKADSDEGFVSIFNGKDLTGWRGATDGYTVEDGILVCQKKGGGNLFTTREFGDFVFRFEYRLEPGGNNGVSIRGQEIQILDDDAPQYKNLEACQYHGSIYCKVPAKRGHTKKAGEWNSQEILCQGSHWKVTLNGAVIVDVDLAKMPGLEELARRSKGPIGFLGHGARVEFRNLRVKEL